MASFGEELLPACRLPPATCPHHADCSLYSAATNNQTGEGVAIKKVTNVFSKKILAKRALREIKLLQHFRGHRNVP
jgi:mitogen-activated protein kinase 7